MGLEKHFKGLLFSPLKISSSLSPPKRGSKKERGETLSLPLVVYRQQFGPESLGQGQENNIGAPHVPDLMCRRILTKVCTRGGTLERNRALRKHMLHVVHRERYRAPGITVERKSAS